VVLGAEAALAFSGGGSPQALGSPDEVTGSESGRPILFVVLGDSTASGVGAVSQDMGFPRRCARALTARTSKRVDLRVFAVSGARVADILRDQLPRLRGLSPDLVLVVVGGNDVIHLTSPGSARRDLGKLLDGLHRASGQVIVSGIPALGTATRLGQPLRLLAGFIAATVYDPIWREETARRSMLWVDLAGQTRPAFSEDHSLLAPDGFHPSPRGYALWAEVFKRVIERATPTAG
jgi:lysophospholipase L1-like esterase